MRRWIFIAYLSNPLPACQVNIEFDWIDTVCLWFYPYTLITYYKIPTVPWYILCGISFSSITVRQGEVAKDITEEIIMELLLHILGVGVALMLLIHQEHLVEDMEKEEVIITDLETIM